MDTNNPERLNNDMPESGRVSGAAEGGVTGGAAERVSASGTSEAGLINDATERADGGAAERASAGGGTPEAELINDATERADVGMAERADPDDATAKAPKKKARKKKTLRSALYKLILVLLVAIFLLSAANVTRIMYKYNSAKNVYKDTAAVAMKDPDKFTKDVDFDALKAINEDVQAWIYQADSPINYPVVQGYDNDKYLHTLVDGTYNGGGTLFVDCRNAAGFADFNSIIYGHHMRDGSMFRCLRGYTKEDGYYESHKTFDLITPETDYTLEVFSAYITPSNSEAYTLKFDDDASKQAFIDNAYEKSKIISDVKVTIDDHIVTLSTCAYDYDKARYVVLCKLVDNNAGKQDEKTKEKIKKAEEKITAKDKNKKKD